MRPEDRIRHRWAGGRCRPLSLPVFWGLTALFLTGCQSLDGTASLGGLPESVGTFLEDFARQLLAAFLL